LFTKRYKIRFFINCKVGFILLISCLSIFFACSNDEGSPVVVYDDTPYFLDYKHFSEPNIAADNPLTNEGVALGRMLFYTTEFSSDGSQSCASCHLQEFAFTDTAQFSTGVLGMKTNRNSMAVFNMAWNLNRFFWDGKAELLRHQALIPIESEVELNETLSQVIEKLNSKQIFKDQFMRAFGAEEITENKIALALEQFMFSIISNSSKYDKFVNNEISLTESEDRGRELFFTEYNQFFPEESGADCAHCHSGYNFENDKFMNNGLDADAEISDSGFEEFTGNSADKAKFKVPSLRNIALTAPYMHDGRFNTLEEVIEHYDEHIKISSTLDPALLQTTYTGLMLTSQDKTDLINFLKTLSDSTLLHNEIYSNPF